MNTQAHYRITNTTVKKPRLDKNGKDLRTAQEKVGHYVSFKDDRGTIVRLPPSRSAIVRTLDTGLLNLREGHYVRIEQIEDIASALRSHKAEEAEAKPASKKKTSKKKTTKKPGKRARKAKATEMGDTPKPGEYEGAVNPDGEPNFVATAKSKETRKREAAAGKGRGKQASETL